jgi:mannose-1-phosphate guanylyltransferase
VILAGGDGLRLRELTTTAEGESIPKQYCSLLRKACLLEDAIARARAIALPQHICSVVAAQHRRWWTAALKPLPGPNIFVQPANRGTANGILLALLELEARSKDAIVVLLPADHYVRDEATMARSLRMAANLASDNHEIIYLLGAEPDSPDEELGYIVPTEQRRDLPVGVLRFIEKPSCARARQLLAQGALWNTFIVAGSVRSLLSLFDEKSAAASIAMRDAIALSYNNRPGALEALYDELKSLDFSREVLQRRARLFQVLRIPCCGWTDLGTPRRVSSVLRNFQDDPSVFGSSASGAKARYLNLAIANRDARVHAAS